MVPLVVSLFQCGGLKNARADSVCVCLRANDFQEQHIKTKQENMEKIMKNQQKTKQSAIPKRVTPDYGIREGEDRYLQPSSRSMIT